jgi:MFS family permease
VTSFAFGFSTTFWWAIMSRSLYGLLNGNLGVYKTYLAEISDKGNQARVFTYMSVTFSVGSIIGPLLSGLTSDPLKQYKSLQNILPSFVIRFLQRYPFSPPNIILAAMNMFAFIFGIFYLKESNKAFLAKKNNNVEMRLNEIQLEGVSTVVNTDSIEATDLYKQLDSVELDESEIEQDGNQIPSNLNSKRVRSTFMNWFHYIMKKLKPESEIFLSYAPLATVAIYAVYGFVGTVIIELLPIWLVLRVEDGGLNFNQRQIGILNAVSFVFLLIWCLLAIPRIINKFGSLFSFRVSIILGAPPILLFPTVNYLHYIPILAWAYLIFVYVWRYSFFQVVFSSMTIMSNNSVTSANMGRLNGIAQSMVALTRAVGPALGTYMFSLTLRVNVFPFNVYFMFFMVAILFLSLLIIAAPLPKSLNEPKTTKTEL